MANNANCTAALCRRGLLKAFLMRVKIKDDPQLCILYGL
jgi:hypothetical protein